MLISFMLISCLITATGVSIIEPVDGETYSGDWLTVRAIIENENVVPDSVNYSLNGEPVLQIPRLNTDWPTYMQNQTRNGFSESPGPTDASILWTAPVTGDWHIFHSPVIVDGTLYFCHDSLYSMSPATGEVYWSYPLSEIGDDSPVVCDGRLFCVTDSIYCFDLATHEIGWVRHGGDSYNSNPVIQGDRLFIVFNAGGVPCAVRCYDIFDGSQIWGRTLSGTAASCMSLWNDLLIVPTWKSLYALETSSGDIVWENTHSVSGYHDSSPCIVGDVIYIGSCDGDLLAIDAASGDLIWELPIQPTSALEATPAFSDNIIVCGNRETLFAADAANAELIWQSDLGLHGSPVIADGIVYWGAYLEDLLKPDSLYAADLLTGEIIWSYLPDSTATLITTPPIVDGILYLPAANGYLYAFGTGLKYTYLDELYAQIGSNELIVTSWLDGVDVAADTVSFTVTQTGVTPNPSMSVNLSITPNPTSDFTAISFEIEEPGMVSLCVFDVSGREVSALLDTELSAGVHSVQWHGCGNEGQPLSSGLYFCMIEYMSYAESKALCVLR